MNRNAALVAFQFTGVGPELSFGRLLGPHEAIRIDPLDSLTEGPLSLSEHAAKVLTALPVIPRAVLGYCTSARLAVTLAASSTGANPPSVILLDPDPISAHDITSEFANIYTGLGGGPVPNFLSENSDLPISNSESLTAMEAELANLAGPLRTAYGGDEIADDLVGELLSRYAAWLRFLTAGVVADPVPFQGRIIVITSGPAPQNLSNITCCDQVTYVPDCAQSGMELMASLSARQATQQVLREALDQARQSEV